MKAVLKNSGSNPLHHKNGHPILTVSVYSTPKAIRIIFYVKSVIAKIIFLMRTSWSGDDLDFLQRALF